MKEAGLREQVKVIIGGAPITQDFADILGQMPAAPPQDQVVMWKLTNNQKAYEDVWQSMSEPNRMSCLPAFGPSQMGKDRL